MAIAKRLSNSGFDLSLWTVGILSILSLLAFGGYYYYDRYVHSNERLVDRQARHLEDRVQNDPQNPDLRVAVATYYLESGMLDLGIQQGEQALAIAPKHVGALSILGKAYLKKGDTAGATAAFEQVVELSKDAPMAKVDKGLEAAYFELGRLYSGQGLHSEAVAVLKKALEIDRSDADARFVLGMAYQGLGDHAAAVREFNEGLRFDPFFAEPYKGLATSYAALGRPTEAAWAEAMVMFSRGQYSEAASSLENLLAQAPDFKQAQLGLGLAYERLGRRDQAIAAIHQYQKAYPNDIVANQALGRLAAAGVKK